MKTSILISLVCAACCLAGTYSTTFPVNQNPLSQGGRFVDGLATGLDWTDMKVTNTSGGLHYACGTMTNSAPPYNDSLAVLTGNWGPTQALDITLYISNQLVQSPQFEEVEYGLRCTVTNHYFTGLFMDCSLGSDTGYFEAGAPNGKRYTNSSNIWPSWTNVNKYSSASPFILTNGSKIHAGITNSTITVFFNGIQVGNWTDISNYIPSSGGAPLISCFHQNAMIGMANEDFGISSFTATDFQTNTVSINFGGVIGSGGTVNTKAGP